MYCLRPAASYPIACTLSVASGAIRTSVQPGGMASAAIRRSAGLLLSGFPSPRRYWNPFAPSPTRRHIPAVPSLLFFWLMPGGSIQGAYPAALRSGPQPTAHRGLGGRGDVVVPLSHFHRDGADLVGQGVVLVHRLAVRAHRLLPFRDPDVP